MLRPGHDRLLNRARIRAVLTALLALAVPAAFADDSTPKPELKRFDAAAYMAHVKYLASDELAGRGTGSKGIDLAAEYIAKQLKSYGCEPAGDDGTYFQNFEVRQRKTLDETAARLTIEGASGDWKLHDDWTVMPFSGTGEFSGPLAFAGFGIEATDHDYNDFAGFDAKGKVLLIFRYEPKSKDTEAEFGGELSSRHAWFRTKARLAAEKGAAALLVVNPPGRPENDTLYDYDLSESGQTYDVPMFHVSRKLADALLKKADMPQLDKLVEEIEAQRKPLTTDMTGLSVRGNTGLSFVPARNVCGLLKGEGSPDEIVIVGAHYDHLGEARARGTDSDAPVIHNGADDNASGTSGVLEMARAFAAGPRPKRSVLFLLFSGEELGLLGSKAFVKEPTVDRVRAMINLDMIGRLNQDKFVVHGIGSAKEFKSLVESAGEAAGVKFWPDSSIPGNSDHFSFHREGIPVLFAFTGIHKEYHRPDDDTELVDGDGAAKIVQMMFEVTRVLANMEQGPTPTSPGEEESAGDDAVARADGDGGDRPQRGGRPNAGAARRAPRVRLGILPDYAGDDQPGMLIESVLPGQSAAKAGMKDGDRIIRIADQKIDGIQDYMTVLRERQPDEEITVVVQRGSEEVTLQIKLEAPPRRQERE